jgi:molybdopterin-guanine dinucleotide biosynthesis protein A
MLDAVILAGGKSERLNGIVPPYHKPFLVINGKALIVAAVEHAQRAGAKRIVIVATGENALPVWQLVGHLPGVRVILDAQGPGRAVYAGLQMCTEERVLVLMSDNIHKADDIVNVCKQRYSIGTRTVPPEEAYRFTRYVDGKWIEGVIHAQLRRSPDDTTIWCGPLVINRLCGLATLVDKEKIGPYLTELSPKFDVAVHVPVTSFDVGIPSVVQSITWE